ncbi:hypothetical protein EDD30_0200 [Couchioplanes caeruleus]|uniref:Translation initiation factor n=1 Tax=Couchioplanes caeruleus TaxID=56438 RepID=A0A3N1GBK3_9ACTN|nr:hypothetical protein EDD30_0200 [Couchioplanes caeruleus]
MAAARTGVRGLGADELQVIRDAVAAGRKPKVVFTESAGQIAGQLGQVVALTDPAESDEWVVVRFGRDELPFAPADLRVAPKGATARKAAPPPPAPPSRPEPEFVIDKPVVPARGGRPGASRASDASGAPLASGVSRGAGRVSEPRSGNGAESARPSGGVTNGRASSHASGSASSALSAQAATSGSSPGAEAPPSGSAASSGSSPGAAASASGAASAAAGERRASGTAPAPRKSSGRAARPKPLPELTVTLAYAEGEWTVAANQGSKALAKPYIIRPAEALRMASLVDVPGVQEAVEQIMAAERAQAEQQAQRLRAELAEIEARLQELGEAG